MKPQFANVFNVSVNDNRSECSLSFYPMYMQHNYTPVSYTHLVEEAGALVVVDRFCFGSTPGREEIHLDPDLPVLESIARHYLTTCLLYTSSTNTTST